jgi:hypothetical protein
VFKLLLLHTLKYLIAVRVDQALGNEPPILLLLKLIFVTAVHAFAGNTGSVPHMLFDGRLT